MDLSKFIATLQQQALYFAPGDRLGDRLKVHFRLCMRLPFKTLWPIALPILG
jgi:hypothetical protein